MPTFKHPCPYCGKFIDRAVAACPYCSQPDPFAPKRCQNCRKIIEDADWQTCPYCGASLATIPMNAATAGSPGAAGVAGTAGAGPVPASTQPASAQGPATNGGASQPVPQVQLERPPLYVEPDAPAPAPQPAGKCSGCGAPMGAGARFCTVCGTMAG